MSNKNPFVKLSGGDGTNQNNPAGAASQATPPPNSQTTNTSNPFIGNKSGSGPVLNPFAGPTPAPNPGPGPNPFVGNNPGSNPVANPIGGGANNPAQNPFTGGNNSGTSNPGPGNINIPRFQPGLNRPHGTRGLSTDDPIPPVPGFDLSQHQGHRVSIGRNPASNVCLNHPAVSWNHVQLDRSGQGWSIQDLSSRNRTLLNRHGQNIPLRGTVPLEKADRIVIAPYTLIYDGLKLEAQGLVELVAENLVEEVGSGAKMKRLLDEIRLVVKPRQFISILGGSGAGKSTLLKALSGYKQASGLVYFNRQDYYRYYRSFRDQVGFVPQSDIIHTELSVRAALTYAAELRLGPKSSRADIKAKVESVMERLQLSPHAGTVVSRLSGGQKKRVSIGVELLTNPTLFFLDEPTSGLDPGLEAEIMQLLRNLADDGHTIILVTHSVQNVSICDNLAVLGSGGVMVYFGPPGFAGQPGKDDALGHFGVSEHSAIYQVVQPRIEYLGNGPNQRLQLALPADCSDAIKNLASQINQQVHLKPAKLLKDWAMTLRQYYNSTTTCTDLIENPLAEVKKSVARPPVPTLAEGQVKPATNHVSLHQIEVLLRRYLAIKFSSGWAMLLLLIQAPIIGFALTAIVGDNKGLLQLPPNLGQDKSGLNAQMLLCLLACSVLWLGVFNAFREIVKELSIYKRERFVNLNIWSYLFSKFIVLFGFCLIQCALIMLPLFIVGIDLNGQGVVLPLALEMYISLVLTALVGVGIGLLISCTMPSGEAVTNITPILILPQIILNPAILKDPQGFLEFVVNLFVATKWGLEALGASTNFKARGLLAGIFKDLSNPAALYLSWAVLLGMLVACLVISYFMLHRKKLWDEVKAG